MTKVRGSVGALLAASFLWAAGAALAHAEAPTVQTLSGQVRGLHENDLDVFRGIPYVAPPVGDLRWRAPQAVTPWRGVRAAEAYAPVCPQRQGAGEYSLRDVAMSEDCLTLNIWSPDVAAAVKAPVMVWIHGGAFRQGAGGIPLYDGSALAKRGVVLVTVNYRLGALGVFGHPALAAEQRDAARANYGFLDQVAALEWVRDHIARFGGDPARVTIFGESAGGVSVMLHMASPRSRGLFAQAIVESGGGWTKQQDLASIDAMGVRMARALDAPDLAALRAIPADRVTEAFGAMAPPLGFGPVVDGKVVVEATPDAFLAGHFAHVPLIIGANTYEQNLAAALPTRPRSMLLILPPAVVDRARTLYGAEGRDDDALGGALFRDGGFTGPARWIARRNAIAGSPAFVYRYAHVRVARRGQVPGAVHGAEVPFVFDSGAAMGVSASAWAPEDRALARAIGDCWVSFAQSGVPQCGGDTWRPVAAAPNSVMLFDDTAKFVEDPWREKLDFHEAIFNARNARTR